MECPPGEVVSRQLNSVNFRVGVNKPGIVGLVKTLCEPLFVIFDFAKFGDDIYDQIVSNYIQGKVI